MPSAGVQVVRVDGLKELLADLRKVDKKLARKTSAKLKKAAELVASEARDRVPIGPDEGGHAKDSIKAGVSGAKAYVKGGKDDVPYYGWLDFGTRTPNGGVFGGGRAGQRAQIRVNSGLRVGPWANTGKGPEGGRFIYPALDAKAEEVTTQVRKAVDEALKEVNL